MLKNNNIFVSRSAWAEILYIFVVLFLIIYGTYFIVRRALVFGARVGGLDYCAAQRFHGQLGILNGTCTCLAGAGCRSDTVSVCTRWMYRTCQLS